jgi:hypothetical protein
VHLWNGRSSRELTLAIWHSFHSTGVGLGLEPKLCSVYILVDSQMNVTIFKLSVHGLVNSNL